MEISDLVRGITKVKNTVTVNLLKLTDPFLDSNLEEKSHKVVIAALYAFLLTPLEIEDIEKYPEIFDTEYVRYIKSEGKKCHGIYSYELKTFGHHLDVTFGRQTTNLSFGCKEKGQAKNLYRMIERRRDITPEIILQAFHQFFPEALAAQPILTHQ